MEEQVYFFLGNTELVFRMEMLLYKTLSRMVSCYKNGYNVLIVIFLLVVYTKTELLIFLSVVTVK